MTLGPRPCGIWDLWRHRSVASIACPHRRISSERFPPGSPRTELIDRAAEIAGKNRTDFVLDAARRAAEQTLLDSTVLAASPKAYREFLARLDATPQPNERLRRSMQTPTPWE